MGIQDRVSAKQQLYVTWIVGLLASIACVTTWLVADVGGCSMAQRIFWLCAGMSTGAGAGKMAHGLQPWLRKRGIA